MPPSYRKLNTFRSASRTKKPHVTPRAAHIIPEVWVYAKCIDGQDQIAKRRIEDALRETGDDEAANHGTAKDSGDAGTD
jgi:hypothetical protein